MTKKKTRKKITLDPLEAIKRLMILQLLVSGISTDLIAEVLNIDSSTVRHMVSVRRIRESMKVNK